MIDLISAAIGAGVLAVGFLCGRASRNAGTTMDRSDPVRPICACTHTLGAHDEAGACLAEVERAHYHPNGTRNGREWVRCACRRYTGPEPLPEYWAPPPVDLNNNRPRGRNPGPANS